MAKGQTTTVRALMGWVPCGKRALYLCGVLSKSTAPSGHGETACIQLRTFCKILGQYSPWEAEAGKQRQTEEESRMEETSVSRVSMLFLPHPSQHRQGQPSTVLTTPLLKDTSSSVIGQSNYLQPTRLRAKKLTSK